MIIVFKLIITIFIVSFFCLGGNQFLWEYDVIPENIYEQLDNILSHVIAWLVIISVSMSGIMLLVFIWTH